MEFKVFKAYDIRGIYPNELNEEMAFKIGQAFVQFLNCKNVVVGRDMRLSSPSLFDSLVKGITFQGANVIYIGLSTTPMMYFAVAKHRFESGINITASHNPKEFNGFKLVREKAIPLNWDTGIQDIRKLIEENKVLQGNTKGKIIKKQNLVQEYVEHALNLIGSDLNFSSFIVVVDTANAMAGIVAPQFFSKLKCKLIPLYFDLNGEFPNHEANPLKEETLQDLKQKVLSEKANLGIAFDGDADRVVFLDEKGNVLQGDLITALISEYLLKKFPGEKIMYDLRSSWIVKETIEANGGKPIIYRVGHAFIKQKMREENALFAGELSSHFYLRSDFFVESPFVVVGFVLSLMKHENKKLSELIAPLQKYFQSGEINSTVKDKDVVLKKLGKNYSNAKKIFYLDGLSIEFNDWWFNVRPSNTEPALRLNLEAKTKQLMEQKVQEVLNLIRS